MASSTGVVRDAVATAQRRATRGLELLGFAEGLAPDELPHSAIPAASHHATHGFSVTVGGEDTIVTPS